jgi:hypothetical protein
MSINEYTFCDDCGGRDHTYENCPDTRDQPFIYDPNTDPLYGNDDMDDEFGQGWDDEPADIDDQGDVNPYDHTYDGMYEDDYIYDTWQSESDLWYEM